MGWAKLAVEASNVATKTAAIGAPRETLNLLIDILLWPLEGEVRGAASLNAAARQIRRDPGGVDSGAKKSRFFRALEAGQASFGLARHTAFGYGAAMAIRAQRAIWLKLGLWPAILVALAPIVVALFHLAPMPMMMTMMQAERPAVHHRATPSQSQQPAHHHHGHGAAADDNAIQLAAAPPEEECPPAEQQGVPSHQAQPHCPLCLWLQGFHALPAPDIALLRQPREHTATFIARETTVSVVTFRAAAQPRAPPPSLPV
jgi:hypothetical protein